MHSMLKWKAAPLICLLILLTACNLTRTRPTTATPTSSASSGKPVVEITSPEEGDEVVVGTDLLVSATATDSVGITRVQLIANNQIVKTVSSESATGDESMNVLLDYRPSAAGGVRLEVIAYRGAVASDPAVVNVTVRANQSQVTATIVPQTNVPPIDPNDPSCRALTNVGLNVRMGPGTVYPVIVTVGTGTQMPIIGRIGDNTWWQVRISGGAIGWVIQRNPLNPNEDFITIFGICTLIPIVNPPPTPIIFTATPTRTPTPTPTRTWTPVPNTITPQPADLLITSITGETTVVIPSGETSIDVSYTVTITNNGQADTGPFNNTYQITPGGPVEELSAVSNLSGGQSIALTMELTFDTAGDFTVRVIADSANNVVELSDFNNLGTLDVTVIQAP
jgi:hypothetical protein